MSSQTTFNELSQQLDEILSKLQSPDVDVDEALELHQRGQKLVKQMSERLNKAEAKISRLKSTKA